MQLHNSTLFNISHLERQDFYLLNKQYCLMMKNDKSPQFSNSSMNKSINKKKIYKNKRTEINLIQIIFKIIKNDIRKIMDIFSIIHINDYFINIIIFSFQYSFVKI